MSTVDHDPRFSSLNDEGLWTHGYNNEAIRQRQSSHNWYYGGMDHFNPSMETSKNDSHEDYANSSPWLEEANAYLASVNGGNQWIDPWIATFDHDRGGTFNAIKEDNYNPFVGNEGAWIDPNSEHGVDARSSINGTGVGYRDDSIAGWFKDAFAGEDMIKHRRDAVIGLNQWNGQERNPDYNSSMDRGEKWRNGKGHGLNKATTRMSQQYFDEMGLAEKYGLTYNDPRPQQYADAYAAVTGGGSAGGYMGGNFMDNYNATQAPATGGVRQAAPAGPQVKPGGFMESYLKKKAESKPSVMSLMTELKDA